MSRSYNSEILSLIPNFSTVKMQPCCVFAKIGSVSIFFASFRSAKQRTSGRPLPLALKIFDVMSQFSGRFDVETPAIENPDLYYRLICIGSWVLITNLTMHSISPSGGNNTLLFQVQSEMFYQVGLNIEGTISHNNHCRPEAYSYLEALAH